MEILIILIIVGIVIAVIAALASKKEENPELVVEEKKKIEHFYSKKKFMTDCEYEFYCKIKRLELELNVKIIPQVNLATIVNKDTKGRYQNQLYRNIDFGIFDSELQNILLLIELNDKTHQNRKHRDDSVRNICNKAQIKLITFYTNKPNEQENVCNVIKKVLNENITKSDQ